MKNYYPMKTFQEDAVVRRLNVLYKLLKDVEVEYDSVSGDASFELDGDVTITGDLTITGSLTGAETQIANAVDDYLEAHPIGPTSIEGEDIAPDDVAATGDISAVGSVSGASGSFTTLNGESNPSVKPVYCHPLQIFKADKCLLTALLFNNSNSPIDTWAKLKTAIIGFGGTFPRLMVTGGYKDTTHDRTIIASSIDYNANTEHFIILGVGTDGVVVAGASNSEYLEDLELNVDDQVNKIN